MGKNVHVTKRSDGQWAVITAGKDKAASLHDTQGKAIDAGRPIAERNRSDLVIHDRDNRIRDRDSYGNDPFPPRDRKH